MRRFLVVLSIAWLGSAGCAAGSSKLVMATPMATAASGGTAVPTATEIPEQLIIEGNISLEVEEIGDVVVALRAHVEGLGGRVINETVRGAERSWSATLKLRIPPAKVEEVVAFLGKRGVIVEKRINASDVSRQLFDQDLAIKNLRATLDRLTVLMAQGGHKTDDILKIEQEMTRIRGQIDQLEGSQRFLKDRVALATLDISISRRAGAVTIARAKAYPGARGAALVLFDPGNRKRVRMGGGFVVHTFLRTMSLEVDIFEKAASADGMSSSNAVIATSGGSAYSDFLGHGQRRVLNPYLGLRLGYGYVDSHRFVIQGEAGLELYKHKYFVIDANVRAAALLGKDTDLALIAGGGATFAF